jgi:peptidoglycan/LPS O-acetylase OafA/YrhL
MLKNQEDRSIALDYLRAFVVLLVVAHHTVLAYTTFIPGAAPSFTAQPRYWQAFPILDRARWVGFDVLVGWNDIFFMSLMFFLSGLFVWRGIERKGGAAFLKRRFLRLGVPFIAAVVFLAPLAYYPAYKLTGADPHLMAYVKTWISLRSWPSGPGWFLWVLLAFDCLAAACFALIPRGMERLSDWWRKMGDRAGLFYLALVIVSACAYVPMATAFGAERWSAFGPFVVQTSRILQYCLYFFVGVWTGRAVREQDLFSPAGKLARRWWMWGLIAFFCYASEIAMVLSGKAVGSKLGFVASCAASSLFLLSVALRFARKNRAGDSLSRNSYGIYITHYVFVIWLQYAFLQSASPAWIKAVAVFVGAVALSWATTSMFRMISRREVAQVRSRAISLQGSR